MTDLTEKAMHTALRILGAGHRVTGSDAHAAPRFRLPCRSVSGVDFWA